MKSYNVNIYREMRLKFVGIEAETPEAAADIAAVKPTKDADACGDCEGENLAALVDVEGDEDYSLSVTIDFEPERQRRAAPKLLEALRWITRCPMIKGPVGTTAYIVSDDRMRQARDAIAEAEAAGIAPRQSSPIIPAKAYSDDHAIDVEFDALPWFVKATDQAILALACCGWGGDYPADDVAIALADAVPDLARLFAYLEIIADDPAKKDCHGFECRVDEARALEWLKCRRPTIWSVLKGDDTAAPTLLEALLAVLPYAENESESLSQCWKRDADQTVKQELEACNLALAHAAAAIDLANVRDIRPAPAEIDVHALLAARQQIAEIWSILDVQSVRADLTDEQAWAVLERVRQFYDAGVGINWDVLAHHAAEIAGDVAETAEEA